MLMEKASLSRPHSISITTTIVRHKKTALIYSSNISNTHIYSYTHPTHPQSYDPYSLVRHVEFLWIK
jgi:hypothetical protein